jgi:hypothetical protein
MMGFGGVTALGCTIGQGLTGVSTLAVGSILSFGAIVGGCLVALRYQMWRLERMESASTGMPSASAGRGSASPRLQP